MEFSRQEYWSGLSFPTPGNLPDPGIEPGSPLLQMDSLPLSHQGSSLSPGTILNQHNLKTEVEVVLTCPLVESWVWGNAVVSAGHCPSPVLGRRRGQGEGIILHIAPFSLSSWNCVCRLERGSGNEKTLIHTCIHTHTHAQSPPPTPATSSV